MGLFVKKKINIILAVLIIVSFCLSSCVITDKNALIETNMNEDEMQENDASKIDATPSIIAEYIYVEDSMKYATYSVINSGHAVLYKVSGAKHTVCVNAGHGTKNLDKLKVYCHPDFSEKVAGGTTKEGSIMASAISEGMVLSNGMTEADVNLLVACILKDKLLKDGYSVLMIRENNECKLDNIARTIIANKYADIHIAIHFDSTENDKGAFFITPYNDERYLSMEPVKTYGYKIYELGNALIDGLREIGVKIWKTKGQLQGDLTQMSYSTIANVDLELGDKGTEITGESIERFADGIILGIKKYFGDNDQTEENDNAESENEINENINDEKGLENE